VTGRLPGGGLIHADAGLTGGAFELFEMVMDAGGGPPGHVHLERDEAFYALEGRFSIVCDGARSDLRPGGFAFVPRGSVHHFKALTDHARILFVVAPAGLEGFFRELARMTAGDSVTDGEARLVLAGRFDSYPAAPA